MGAGNKPSTDVELCDDTEDNTDWRDCTVCGDIDDNTDWSDVSDDTEDDDDDDEEDGGNRMRGCQWPPAFRSLSGCSSRSAFSSGDLSSRYAASEAPW